MDYDIQLIGQRLQAARKAKRYTQDYVSAQANISEKFLSQIECGKSGLSVQTLVSLCNILEVTPNYVLLSDIAESEAHPLLAHLSGLKSRQIQDAETIIRLFADNCRR